MHFVACFLHYSSKTCPFHFYSLSFPPCNPMPNILEWKYQHRNCLHTWIINSISGENAITLVISWVLSPLDRCIIRVLLKKNPRYKIRSIYLVSCRLCNGYCSPPSSPQPCFEALKSMNTHQVAFVVYKTPGQKHCWTDLLHCPFQRWNPRDQILDPICKTGKQINSDVPSSCFPAAFPVQGSWGKKRTQILTWFMWCSPGKLSSNRGSTGHSWLKLLDTPGAAEDLHWTPALLLLEFGAVLSHHFLPPVTAWAALHHSQLDTRSPQSWGKDLFHSLVCIRAGESGHESAAQEEPKSVRHTSWAWHHHEIPSPCLWELLHSVTLWTNTWNPYKVTFNFAVIKQKAARALQNCCCKRRRED